MIRIFTTALLAAALTLGLSSEAGAKPHRRPAASGGAMAEGGYVLPPVTFTKFCLDYPNECAGGSARVHMDANRMEALEDVNRQVNGSIAATRNTSRFHFWKLNVAQGDCNNYAIQKRHELIQRGWPAGALSLSVVKTSWGEGHLVVTVRTDAGDYVLDNLRSNIVDWRRTGYRWMMRQSSHNPQYWVALNGGAAARSAVASGEAGLATDSQAEDDAPAAKIASVAAAKRARAARAAEPATTSPRGGSGMFMGMDDFSALSRASTPAGPAALTLGATQGALAPFSTPLSVERDAWAGAASWIAFDQIDAWALRGSIDETPAA